MKRGDMEKKYNKKEFWIIVIQSIVAAMSLCIILGIIRKPVDAALFWFCSGINAVMFGRNLVKFFEKKSYIVSFQYQHENQTYLETHILENVAPITTPENIYSTCLSRAARKDTGAIFITLFQEFNHPA